MLLHAKMAQDNPKIEQLRADSEGLQDLSRIRSEVNLLIAARYFVLFMGGMLLMSLAAQAIFSEGGVEFARVLKVSLVAIFGPGMVWVASDKEIRLLNELESRNKQLEQRIRENLALNRMTQEHLADCFNYSQDQHSEAGPSHTEHSHHEYQQTTSYQQANAMPQLRPAVTEIFTEPSLARVRTDVKNVIVLDPEDNSYDRRYFEATAGVRS